MPVPDNCARFDERRWGPDFDKSDDGRGNHDNCRGVHDNAQRAMIGIACEWMDVRHLDHGQKRQQDEAHYPSHAKSTWL